MVAGITETDRFGEVRSRGERAWHRLGDPIPEGLTAEEAFPLIGLDWDTALEPVYYNRMTPEGITPVNIEEHRVHVRADNGAVLGIVGADYKQVPNLALARFADQVVGPDRAAMVETAGSLLGGRKVFVLLRMPGGFEPVPGDVTMRYVLAVNGHGGFAAHACYPTSVRVVCANTERMAETKDGTKGVRYLHTSGVSMEKRAAAARLVLGSAESDLAKAEALMRGLAATPARPDYFEGVFAALFGDPSKAEPETATKLLAKRAELVKRWSALATIEAERFPQAAGTSYLAYQAVSTWSEHEYGRLPDGGARRAHSNLFGAGHARKARALALAVR